ncbi:spore coat protein CotH [Spirosoma sp. HMF4905]|uniref:Spore coat protein CotH n=1 Tax=Spirosoma arboris TaxID=2682092 RepID=A0A7K1SC23_9BACT|nr:CotH kinase family protein [Spirosoma arboris]MVM31357.1 spore coat protein CotH [Spirosoma arboris]
MKKLLTLLALGLGITFVAKSQQLYINEFMASNQQTIADATGAHEDWFEIYNPNSFSVNIGGYYITDNLSNPTKYQFPTGSPLTVVPANGFLLIWASGATSRGANHISFSLSADGEQIGLYRLASSVLEVVDSLSFGRQRTDISLGRQPNGSSAWRYFQASTSNTSPGASNNGKTGYADALTTPVFSQTGGFYSTGFNLGISTTDPSATIYYTLDGSDPDPSNPNSVTFAYKNSYREQPSQPNGPFLTGSYRTYPYSTTIAITDRTSSPNTVSTKASSWNFTPSYFPTTSIFKGTVVRAMAYKANAIPSDIVTQTYFVTPSLPRYSIPVVSITLNEKHLFDYNTGIYTAGVTFDNWRTANPTTTASYCTTGNFSNEGDASERPGNVEFFLNNASVINQRIGLRIHGGCSRFVPRKSLRLYGSGDFEYPFFDNRPASLFYNRLILRNGGNDWDYTTLVDAFGQRMVRHLPFDTQSNRPSALFLNGEYWGVHNLYERYDKYYVNRNYAVATDSVDMVEISLGYEANEGDLVSYNALKTYFTQTSPVNYTYVRTQMDVENFADYQIAEIFVANTDWPANNVSLWRKRTSQYKPTAPYGHDGRWRWMLRDLDFGLTGQNYAQQNTLDNATMTTSQYAEFTLFFRRLLDIPAFKTYFINRYADLLNTTFHPTRTVALLDSIQQQYQPYMPEHFNRWITGTNFTSWLSNMGNINNFLQLRPDSARKHLRLKFGLTATRSLTINVSNTAQGYVKVNTIDILPTTVGVPASPYPWTGVYFQGNPITLVAKAKAGFIFQYWKEGNTIVSTDTAYSFNPTANRNLVAIFELDNSFDSTPASYTLLSCDYRFTNWPSTSPAGTHPANMLFVSMNQEDPLLTATISNTVTGAYAYTSRTRINGLGTNGISFINTGNNNTNPGYVASTLGGALLALRTTGLNQAYVQWTGGTITANPKQYNIRLRYRIGDSGPFTDLLDASNNPVEYVRNATAGHSQVIGPVALPASLLNQPYVQLFWQYYWTGIGTNARDELRLDDIIITRGSCESLASGPWNVTGTWSCGRVPTSCDAVKINPGHVVTISIPNAIAKRVEFDSNAKLLYATTTAALSIQPDN